MNTSSAAQSKPPSERLHPFDSPLKALIGSHICTLALVLPHSPNRVSQPALTRLLDPRGQAFICCQEHRWEMQPLRPALQFCAWMSLGGIEADQNPESS